MDGEVVAKFLIRNEQFIYKMAHRYAYDIDRPGYGCARFEDLVDIGRDAIIDAVERHKGDTDEPVNTFVLFNIRNKMVDHCRKVNVRTAHEHAIRPDPFVQDTGCIDLSCLTETQREYIERAYGLNGTEESAEEIARANGTTQEAVNATIDAALQRLKRYLIGGQQDSNREDRDG